jgi:hypothetical protein
MEKLLEAIIKSAGGQLSVLLLLGGILMAGSVIGVLWMSLNAERAKNDKLHDRIDELLREMLDMSTEFGKQQSKLTDEMRQTIALVIAAVPQQAKRD